MSEGGWLQLATLLIGMVSMWVGLHYKLKGVDEKQDIIKNINLKQDEKIAIVKENIQDVHTEINSRLSQYIKVAVEAALARGVAEGVELERQRNIGKAHDLLNIAKTEAEKLVETAKVAAIEIVTTAKENK